MNKRPISDAIFGVLAKAILELTTLLLSRDLQKWLLTETVNRSKLMPSNRIDGYLKWRKTGGNNND